MKIIATRRTVGNEPGTHLADVEINGESGLQRGHILLTVKSGDLKAIGDVKALVVGGCNLCCHIYSPGHDEVIVRKTNDAHFIMG